MLTSTDALPVSVRGTWQATRVADTNDPRCTNRDAKRQTRPSLSSKPVPETVTTDAMFCGTLVGSSCATAGPSTYENSKPSAGTSNAFGATVKDTAPASCAGAVQRASEADTATPRTTESAKRQKKSPRSRPVPVNTTLQPPAGLHASGTTRATVGVAT